MTTLPETIRANVIHALRLAASPEQQSDYARQVPIAHVPAEVFCQWEDVYWPDEPSFADVFTSSELAALAEYHRVWAAVAGTAPTSGLSDFQASDEWCRLAQAAERAVEVLDQAG